MTDGRAPRANALGVAICVPARNEACFLPRLFEAVEELDRPREMTLTLCLLLDGCSDDSLAVAEAYRRRAGIALRIAVAPNSASNAGIARDRAMRMGLAVLESPGDVLLTTDADSWPRSDWVAAMVAALDQADIVAGRIVRDGRRACPDQDRIEHYYERLFALRRQIDPVPWEAAFPHHQAGGANMGMRVATYRTLGGFPHLASGEDARLIDDAARQGLAVRRDAASIVHTSDRRTGRAPSGLAETLHRIDRQGLSDIAVAHPLDQIWQYRAQARARAEFSQGRFETLSALIALDRDHLTGVARDCPNAEAFAMRVVPVPPGGMRTLPFPMAEAALAAILANDMSACAA